MSSTPPSTAPFDSGMKDAQASFLSLLDPETEQPTEANIENETEELESIEADAEEAQLVLADDDADVDDELIEDLEDDIEIPQEDLTFTVKINGEEIEVPVDELRKGYSRQADANVLAGLQEQLHNSTAEPDWNALREADPNAYAVEWAAHQQRSQQQNAITEEQNRLRQIHHYQMQENAAAQLSDEQSKLMTAIPEWGDAEVARTEKLALIDYGKSIGFSEEELGNVTDHRSVLALRNAMRFSSLESKAKNVKPVNGKPTLKPGSSKTVPRKRTSLQRAQTRLQKTGTAAAAADVFAQMLDRE